MVRIRALRAVALLTLSWLIHHHSWYHIDLDLPKTGIADHADSVPLPGEQAQSMDEGPQMQFLAMISLLRLITRTHDTLFHGESSSLSPAAVLVRRSDELSSCPWLKGSILGLQRSQTAALRGSGTL